MKNAVQKCHITSSISNGQINQIKSAAKKDNRMAIKRTCNIRTVVKSEHETSENIRIKYF